MSMTCFLFSMAMIIRSSCPSRFTVASKTDLRTVGPLHQKHSKTTYGLHVYVVHFSILSSSLVFPLPTQCAIASAPPHFRTLDCRAMKALAPRTLAYACHWSGSNARYFEATLEAADFLKISHAMGKKNWSISIKLMWCGYDSQIYSQYQHVHIKSYERLEIAGFDMPTIDVKLEHCNVQLTVCASCKISLYWYHRLLTFIIQSYFINLKLRQSAINVKSTAFDWKSFQLVGRHMAPFDHYCRSTLPWLDHRAKPIALWRFFESSLSGIGCIPAQEGLDAHLFRSYMFHHVFAVDCCEIIILWANSWLALANLKSVPLVPSCFFIPFEFQKLFVLFQHLWRTQSMLQHNMRTQPHMSCRSKGLPVTKLSRGPADRVPAKVEAVEEPSKNIKKPSCKLLAPVGLWRVLSMLPTCSSLPSQPEVTCNSVPVPRLWGWMFLAWFMPLTSTT